MDNELQQYDIFSNNGQISIQPSNIEDEDNHPRLSDDEFDSLIKSVQLLRIAQLRYIVQKFSIPASGNKTKLLSLVISIFQNRRNDSILIDILSEINNLLSQQQESLYNPLIPLQHLEVTNYHTNFHPLPNPILIPNMSGFLLGPIGVKPGQGSGCFQFNYESTMPVIFNFFVSDDFIPFSVQFEVNGFPFEIFSEDPLPQPIDITQFLHESNSINIKNIYTKVPLMIVIQEYSFVGIQQLVTSICGNVVPSKSILARSNLCNHDPFLLVPFLSKALATNKWECPICGRLISKDNLVPIPSRIQTYQPVFDVHEQNPSGTPSFPSESDLFRVDSFDWDVF